MDYAATPVDAVRHATHSVHQSSHQRVDITLADLSAYDPHPLRSGGKERYLCPFCGGDKGRSNLHRCLILDDKGAFYCFRCQTKGRIGYPASREWIDEAEYKRRRQEAYAKERKEEWQQILRARRMLAQTRQAPGTRGALYLMCERGVSPAFLGKANVRFTEAWFDAPATVFPAYDEQGRLMAAQGRYIEAHEPRMITLGKASKGMFFGWGRPDKRKRFPGRIAIAEAPLDALSYQELYNVPSVASLGCWQQKFFLPMARQLGCLEVVLATDNDSAGHDSAAKWATLCREQGIKCIRHIPPTFAMKGDKPSKDWNDALRRVKGIV